MLNKILRCDFVLYSVSKSFFHTCALSKHILKLTYMLYIIKLLKVFLNSYIKDCMQKL